MGFDDREYAREHFRRATALRRRSDAWSNGRIAVCWLVLGAALFAALRLTSPTEPTRQRLPPRQPVDAARVQAARPMPVAPPVALPASLRRDDLPAPSAAPIYRCGSSYGTTPCANGRQVQGPAASGFDSRPSEALASLVARGRTADANTVTTVTRTVTTVDDGTVPYGADGRVAACRQLAEQIEWIDRAARQPRGPAEQDRLRAQRRAARDRQAALRC